MTNTRDTIIQEIKLRLGDLIVDVELQIDHLDLSITKAVERIRQRSDMAKQEDFIVIGLEIDKNTYILDKQVLEVREVLRRNLGVVSSTGSGVDIEPFSQAYMNQFLLYNNGGTAGWLTTYDALFQKFELLRRLFGADLQFTWNNVSKTLTLHRRIKTNQEAIVHVYRERHEDELFNDYMLVPLLKDYALAFAKHILGTAYSKYANVVGPNGGTTLSGETLRTEATTEMERLDMELLDKIDGGLPAPMIIG